MMEWMTNISASLNPAFERLGWVLFHSLWQFGVIALIAWGFGAFLRNRGPNLRYISYTGLFSLFLGTSIATWYFVGDSQLDKNRNDQIRHTMLATDSSVENKLGVAATFEPEQYLAAEENTDEVNSTKTTSPAAASSSSEPSLPSAEENKISSQPKASAVERLGAPVIPAEQQLWTVKAKESIRSLLPLFVLFWILGVFLLLFRPIMGWVLLNRIRRVGTSQPTEEIQNLAKRLTRQMRVTPRVQLLVSSIGRVPMVVGYFRPVILLPISLATNMPTTQIESILAHELAHIRRHDFVVNLFQLLTETFFFYHPAVWWLSNRIRMERENCCDDAVIETTHNRSEYGRALIAIAEQNQSHTNLALSASDGQLLSRIQRIAGLADADSPRTGWPVVVGFAIIMTLVASIGLPAMNRITMGSDFAHEGSSWPSQNQAIWKLEFWKTQSNRIAAIFGDSFQESSTATEIDDRFDVSFLKQYPKLEGISYDMGSQMLIDILKSREIPYRKFFTRNGYENFLMNADSTHCVRVSFGPYGHCAEIQRFRSSVPQDRVETMSYPTFALPDQGYISAVGLDPKTNHLVTVAPWHYVTIKRWDVKTKKLVSEIKLKSHGGPQENRAADNRNRPFQRGVLKLSSDTHKLILATLDYVGIWDTRTGDLIQKLEFPRVKWEYDSIQAISASEDYSIVVGQLGTSYSRTTLVYDANIIVWDGNTGKQLRIINDKRGTILSDIDLSKDGKTLVTSNGSRARIWNVSDGEMIAEFKNKNEVPDDKDLTYGNYIWSSKISPDGKYLAIGDLLGVKLWNINTKKLIHKMEGDYRYSDGSHGSRLVFSDDGNYLLRTGTASKAKGYYIPIWSTRTGQKHFELITKSSSVQFLDGNSRIAVGIEDREKSLGIWQLSGQPSKEDLSYKSKHQSSFNTINSRYVHKGEKADELIEKWKPVWGPKYNHGLQAGIAFTSPKPTYKKGERVSMAVFLRNWKKEAIKIDIKSDLFTHFPEIKDSNGNVIKLETVKFLGKPPHYRDQLAGGQSFGPFHISFGIGENPKPGEQDWAPFLKETPAGELELGFELPLRVDPLETEGLSATYRWVEHQHMTGKLKFKIEK